MNCMDFIPVNIACRQVQPFQITVVENANMFQCYWGLVCVVIRVKIHRKLNCFCCMLAECLFGSNVVHNKMELLVLQLALSPLLFRVRMEVLMKGALTHYLFFCYFQVCLKSDLGHLNPWHDMLRSMLFSTKIWLFSCG